MLTASDLNAEFNNLLSNSLTLISPLTGALDLNGFELILDADGDTSITADTNDQIDIRIGGSDRWRWSASGHLLAVTDNTYDIGASGATRPRDLYVARNVLIAGNATLGDAVGDSHTVNGNMVVVDDGSSAITASRSGGGDRVTIGGQAAGSGGQIAGLNDAATDYVSLSLQGALIAFYARTGAGTVAEIARVTNTALIFPTDNTYDIGASGATRPKDIFAAGSISAAGAVNATTIVNGATITATGALSGATAGGAMVATQANQETGTATNLVVSPGRQQFHPSAAKGWGKLNITGGADASYNVTSVTDNGTGDATVVWNVDFSSSEHVTTATPFVAAAAQAIRVSSLAVGQDNLVCFTTTTGAAVDPTCYLVTAFGDQ